MDAYAQPANTEFSYQHLFTPHPYLFTSSATMIPPLDPNLPKNGNFLLPELAVQQNQMLDVGRRVSKNRSSRSMTQQ